MISSSSLSSGYLSYNTCSSNISISISLTKHKQLKIYKYIPLSNMESSPITLSPSMVNNPPCSFWGSYDIGSYISRHNSSFGNTYDSKTELISLFCLSSNLTRNFFFPTTACTHPSTYLRIGIIHDIICNKSYLLLEYI